MLSTYLPAKTSCCPYSRLIFLVVIHTTEFWSVFLADFRQQGINNVSLGKKKDTQHVSNAKCYASLSSFFMFWWKIMPHLKCKCNQCLPQCASFWHLCYLPGQMFLYISCLGLNPLSVFFVFIFVKQKKNKKTYQQPCFPATFDCWLAFYWKYSVYGLV